MKSIFKYYTIIFFLTIHISCSSTTPYDSIGKTIQLKVLTYNIYGYKPISRGRTRALINTIIKSNADIIALQEANDWFLNELRKYDFITKNYYFLNHPSDTFPDGKVYTLSKYPIVKYEYHNLPSRITRKYLEVHIQTNGSTIPVINVHLESPLEAYATRIKQMKLIMNRLDDYDNAIIAGDFNFGDNDKNESSFLNGQSDFHDLWKTLYPDRDGLTWNKQKNYFALQHSFPEEGSRRLDRIVVKSETLRPLSMKMVGQKKIVINKKHVYPSDHFGLLGAFEFIKK